MPIKPPIIRYGVLAFLFIVTVMYETGYIHDILRDETLSYGYVVPKSASNKIEFIGPPAAQAGLHVGDLLLSVNGVPYTGSGPSGGVSTFYGAETRLDPPW